MKVGLAAPPLICETSEVSWPVRKVSRRGEELELHAVDPSCAPLRQRVLEAGARRGGSVLERDDHALGADGSRGDRGSVQHEVGQFAQ